MMSWPVIAGLVVAVVLIWAIGGVAMWKAAIAVVGAWLIMRIGFATLQGFGTPLPPPPPPGELRKVRLIFRCSICGTEVRMTAANDEVPEPPRHCQEDMDLVAPIDG